MEPDCRFLRAQKIESDRTDARPFSQMHSRAVTRSENLGGGANSRAAGMYEDIRTGPHHVFRIRIAKLELVTISQGEYMYDVRKFLDFVIPAN